MLSSAAVSFSLLIDFDHVDVDLLEIMWSSGSRWSLIRVFGDVIACNDAYYIERMRQVL